MQRFQVGGVFVDVDVELGDKMIGHNNGSSIIGEVVRMSSDSLWISEASLGMWQCTVRQNGNIATAHGRDDGNNLINLSQGLRAAKASPKKASPKKASPKKASLVGAKVRFKDDAVSKMIPSNFVSEGIFGDQVVHGATILGPTYFRDFAKIVMVDATNKWYLVEWYEDQNARTMRLGFSLDQLVFLEKVQSHQDGEKIDIKALEKLVLAAEVKQEIISVLKQVEYSSKIFDEWGLGETIEYGKGMGLLFWGGPGTGKTWGAHCIAKALGKELMIVNAANIQTSEPGGANRNIQDAFKNATSSNKVLFMDECDSLIGSRDNLGMILSSEVNTLLTEIEKFEGVCILATNRIETLDEALERRLSLIVEFPAPDFDARQGIWQKLIPKKMPLGKEVSMEALAQHALTGGQIKNSVLQAARLAAAAGAKKVELPHFEQAISRIRKSGGLMGKTPVIHLKGGHQDYTVGKARG